MHYDVKTLELRKCGSCPDGQTKVIVQTQHMTRGRGGATWASGRTYLHKCQSCGATFTIEGASFTGNQLIRGLPAAGLGAYLGYSGMDLLIDQIRYPSSSDGAWFVPIFFLVMALPLLALGGWVLYSVVMAEVIPRRHPIVGHLPPPEPPPPPAQPARPPSPSAPRDTSWP